MKYVHVYTDGACKGNPGPGGWAAILRYQNVVKEIAGGEGETTNNRMELTAMIRALEQLKESCYVIATSDSRYLLDGLQKGWAEGWRLRGWRKKDGKPALNADLWDRLLFLTGRHKMEYHWIRGHAGHPENERADQLASAEAERQSRP
jgi:ribonuclease HI